MLAHRALSKGEWTTAHAWDLPVHFGSVWCCICLGAAIEYAGLGSAAGL